MERIQRRASKHILNLPFHCQQSYKDRLIQLNLLPLKYWHEYLDINWACWNYSNCNLTVVTPRICASTRATRFTSNPDITLFLIRCCKTTIFQKSFFNRTSSIWNALAADLALFCFCSLSSFKTALYGNYKQALVASYNPDDPRCFKSICLTCNASHNLGRNITSCF